MNDAVSEHNVGGAADTAKLVVAILLIGAGIAGFYLLATQSEWLRWFAVAAGVALAGAVFATSARGKAVWQFALEARAELRKVVWPTREETGKITLAVFMFVGGAGVFFWLLDLLLSWVLRLLGQGGS